MLPPGRRAPGRRDPGRSVLPPDGSASCPNVSGHGRPQAGEHESSDHPNRRREAPTTRKSPEPPQQPTSATASRTQDHPMASRPERRAARGPSTGSGAAAPLLTRRTVTVRNGLPTARESNLAASREWVSTYLDCLVADCHPKALASITNHATASRSAAMFRDHARVLDQMPLDPKLILESMCRADRGAGVRPGKPSVLVLMLWVTSKCLV
jgi:hypothetical protein